MKSYTLISVLGWEDRYCASLEIVLTKYNIKKIILISFVDYLCMDNMQRNLTYTNDACNEKTIRVENIDLQYSDSVGNWKILESRLNEKDEYLLNISTIPRETIWTLFFFLKKQNLQIDYVYFKPDKYCAEWLTKNHKSPRLLFKHSGIFDLNKHLALFVIAGFDISRLDQIIDFFEPDKLIIFYQKGNQFENDKRNKDFEKYTSFFENLEVIGIDTYDVKSATEAIFKKYAENENYNVIIDSQGPKVSALSVYSAYTKSKNRMSLAYVAAKDFNKDYSTGINENFITGKFKFDE